MTQHDQAAGAVKDTDRRLVIVAVQASHMYCSNECQHMELRPFPLQGQRCRLFTEDLSWDKFRDVDGNYRLAECQRLEVPVP